MGATPGQLALELLAPIFLAVRVGRVFFAVAVAVMHGSIWMFLGLDYSAWVLTVAAVAIPMGWSVFARTRPNVGSERPPV